MKRKAPNLYMICVGSVNHSLLATYMKHKQIHTTCLLPSSDTKFCPWQYKTKSLLVWQCALVSRRPSFNQLPDWIGQLCSTAESVVLKVVTLWLAVTLLNRLRTARMHLLFEWVLPSFHMCNFWASLLQYTQLVDRQARHPRKTPDFELRNFFGQLKRIFLLELPSAQRLNLDRPTTVIVALIREAKATLRNGIYYYKNLGVDEVVDLSTLQCVVGRIEDRDEWAIIDRSDNVDIQIN